MSKQACTVPCVSITLADLPVSCPPQDLRIWDAHPRVYLEVDSTGKVNCPYCGTQYELKNT